MEPDNMDFVLSGKIDQLVDVCVVDAKFAFRPARDNLVCLAGSQIRIEPDKNLFVSELVFKPFQSL